MNAFEFLREKVRSRADRAGIYGTVVPDVSILNWIDEAERQQSAEAAQWTASEKRVVSLIENLHSVAEKLAESGNGWAQGVCLEAAQRLVSHQQRPEALL